MKKMKQAFIMLGVMIMAGSFFAACGDPEPNPEGPTGPTYTLTIRLGGSAGETLENVEIPQGKTPATAISRTLTASDDSSTAGIPFTYACTNAGHTNAAGENTCGVTVNTAGTQINVAANATVGAHPFTVTAKKDSKTVATANFTVTVTLAPYGVTFNPNIVSVPHGSNSVLNHTLAAPNGATTGLTLAFVCTTHPTNCGLTFTGPNAQSRYEIGQVANTVAVGEHAITVTLNGAPVGTPSVTTPLTVRVGVKYTLNTTLEEFEVQRGATLDLSDKYTLSVSAGQPESDIKVGVGCRSDYDNCDAVPFGADRDWANLSIAVPATATVGKVHTVMMEAYADDGNGVLLAEKQFTIKVLGP